MDKLMLLLLALFTSYYWTRVLLIEDRVSHFGPFASRHDVVARLRRNADGGQEVVFHPVTLWEHLRRVFGLYHITYDEERNRWVWMISESRVEVWTCPKCLSFWVSLAVAPILFAVTLDFPLSLLFIFGSAGLTTYLEG